MNRVVPNGTLRGVEGEGQISPIRSIRRSGDQPACTSGHPMGNGHRAAGDRLCLELPAVLEGAVALLRIENITVKILHEEGKQMLTIGCHLSSAKGYTAMAKEAEKINANTFQFFTRNPRGGKAKAIDPKDVEQFHLEASRLGIQKILAHAPYTLNACSPDEKVREFAYNTMADDLKRMEYTPGNCYNFHPGSHVKQGAEKGIELIAELLNNILRPEQSTTVLLETMAGKGSEVGRNFQELREILDRVELQDKMGVCLDTCHIYDGGYDIVNDLDGVLKEFDQVIGLSRLKAVHLNDSMYGLNSHKDRHAKIGEGKIGKEAMIRIINHPALKDLPFYLETPNDLEGYKAEIAFLRSVRQES